MKKLLSYSLVFPLSVLFLTSGKDLADATSIQVPDIFEDQEILQTWSNNYTKKTPGQKVDSLAAKSSDWKEPSRQSEEKYKMAMRQWLDSLPPPQKEKTYKILMEAHSEIHALREAIRNKKGELANLSFNRHTTPEALPRLGQELQSLRKTLFLCLKTVSKRLKNEAGITLSPLEEDSFWLVPPDIMPANPAGTSKPAGKLDSGKKQAFIILEQEIRMINF